MGCPDRCRVRSGAGRAGPWRAVCLILAGDGVDGVVHGHLDDGHRARLLGGRLRRHRAQRLRYGNEVPLGNRVVGGGVGAGSASAQNSPRAVTRERFSMAAPGFAVGRQSCVRPAAWPWRVRVAIGKKRHEPDRWGLAASMQPIAAAWVYHSGRTRTAVQGIDGHRPLLAASGVRQTGCSTRGKRSPGTSIATRAPSSDGRSASACPCTGTCMRSAGRCTPTAPSWMHGGRAGVSDWSWRKRTSPRSRRRPPATSRSPTPHQQRVTRGAGGGSASSRHCW